MKHDDDDTYNGKSKASTLNNLEISTRLLISQLNICLSLLRYVLYNSSKHSCFCLSINYLCILRQGLHKLTIVYIHQPV